MMGKDCYIRISDIAGSLPTRDWSPDVFEGLSLESVNPGGFTTANFTIHRAVEQYWPDLQYKNHVLIGRGADIYWEGYIDRPARSINPDTIDVSCLGWSARLNQLWTEADVFCTAAANDQLSDFLTTIVFADASLEVVAGTIETGDYVFPTGTIFEFKPTTDYFSAIEQMNAPNNYDWGVWVDKAFDFKAKVDDLRWIVYLDDCSDLSVAPNTEALCNYVLVDYTQDGSHHEQVVVQDTDSQALYGIIKKRVDIPGRITTAGATQLANTYLAECKDLKVSASFATSRIFDIYGAEHHLAEARGGDNLRLLGWLATEGTLYNLDNITTFQVKSVKYDNDRYSLDVTPAEFIPSTELQIARLQAVGY
jgi:hypothetical protein